MTDREFMEWMYTRLIRVHNEPQFADYMHRLRAIINMIPLEQKTGWS